MNLVQKMDAKKQSLLERLEAASFKHALYICLQNHNLCCTTMTCAVQIVCLCCSEDLLTISIANSLLGQPSGRPG